MANVVVIAGLAESLVNFRGQLLVAMIEAGHRVVAIASDRDEGVARRLSEMGVPLHIVPMSRAGLNPLADIAYAYRVYRLLRKLQPEVVLAYTIKPVVYGMIAARLARVRRRFALVTGLGYAFLDIDQNFQRKLVNRIACVLYRLGLSRVSGVFFQNPDDQKLFQMQSLIGEKVPSWVINGSGVDTSHFALAPLPDGPIFLFVGRLLRDKGVREYAEAAKIVRAEIPGVIFHLVGPFDHNPSGVTQTEVSRWVDAGDVNYHGSSKDVREWIARSSVYVLPSYREGTPRSVLEAMSMGRPIITTDAPGCRETVVPGENGILVPPRDTQALAAAMVELALQADTRQRMGDASRMIAVDRYDVHSVNAQILAKMQLTS
ncbi:glycosyltransferase family 4 protein [Pandoraea thiooxydans]|uniref:glycosyltransferase family 4 protein n=1 Tax=Pandoraea thiooxydans TaxID=445709 RepID=UPI00093501DC|nr:glycosyltransferase family 4 protein [Pandoraea thiooxydans]